MRNSSGAPVSPPRDQVQCGLAEMRPRLLDQRDLRPVALAELVTQARGKFEAAGTTTDVTIRCSVPKARQTLVRIHGRCHRRAFGRRAFASLFSHVASYFFFAGGKSVHTPSNSSAAMPMDSQSVGCG